MVTARLHWSDLPQTVRDEIEERTGPVHKAQTVSGGYNSSIAVRLDTGSGTIFLKGLSSSHPRVWTQSREAAVAPYTRDLAPPLLWRMQSGGWDLLAFRFLDGGHHADYSADSPDLPLLADTLTSLAQIPAPPIELKDASSRWASYLPDPETRSMLGGTYLAHTDFNPENVIIKDGNAVLVDWGWASAAAPWVDPALCCIWLVSTGRQSPQEAEQWAARMPAWRTAPPAALDAFAQANARLWASIADQNPGPWSTALREAARRYAEHRNGV